MKLKHLLSVAALALPATMMGAPAYPGVLMHTNPDGTTVEYRLNGDEFFSYITNAEGTTIMERNVKGQMVPMMRNGVELKATAESIELLRYEANLAPSRIAGTQEAPQRMPALTKDGRTTFPTKTTEVHSLVILMEYADTKFTMADPKAAFTDWLNKEGYNEHHAVGSARDYYMAASNGQFAPTFDVAGVVELPQTSAYYVGNGKYATFGEALVYALDAVDDEVDFSKYDFDGDGTVDTVYFIYAGYGQADTGDETTVWPHQSILQGMIGTKKSLDGVYVNPYATSQELKGGSHYYYKDGELAGIGTFCHEFGHVLGLPDLYDPNYNSQCITPNEWSIMDQGSYSGDSNCPPLFSAYERWVCWWLEYDELEDMTSYEIPTIDQSNKAYRVNINRGTTTLQNEYFVIESRRQEGWDLYLPNDGVLVWHINYSANKWISNSVNSDKNKPGVYILASDGSGNPFLKNYGATSNMASWPNESSGLNYIYPEGDISFESYIASAENDKYVTNIAYDSTTGIGSFDYNMISVTPNDVTVLHDAELVKDEYGRKTGFLLTWDAVEGATGYALTIWRENSSGKKYYINSCEELNIGNVTSYEVKGLSNSMLGTQMNAYVRVLKELPSTEISNTVTFVTNDLVSVENVEADNTPIFGVKGAVVAPEGAEVYSLAGVKAENGNLAAGLYIVRYNGKSYKVIVK